MNFPSIVGKIQNFAVISVFNNLPLKMTQNSSNLESFIKVFKRFLFIAFLAFSLTISFLLPENIPIHFNANGDVDRIANKSYFIVLPLIGIVIYFLIYFTRIYLTSIQKLNNGSNVIESKSNFLIFSLLQISVLLVFIIIIVSTYLISKNTIHNLGSWFLPFTIMILCLPTFFYLIDNYINKS